MTLTKNVVLSRGSDGYGFSVIGGSDTYLPPMVFTIAPGKPADLSQQVEKGDRIVSINGASVANVSAKKVIQMINDSTSSLTLCLQDDADLKKRLNAFMEAKARSNSPNSSTINYSTPPPKAASAVPTPSPAKTGGRPLYQPRSGLRDSNLSSGSTPPSHYPPSYTSPEKIKQEDRIYNDLDGDETQTSVRQTSLNLISDDNAARSGGSFSVRDDNRAEMYDINPIFSTPPPHTSNTPPPRSYSNDDNTITRDSNTSGTVPIYSQVSKSKEKRFSGLRQVYNPPPEYDNDEPPLPLDLPPDIPPRETAESCARRLFYQDGCVPRDVSLTLASTVSFDEEVAGYYMQHFNFDNYRLDDAVRVFVERVPLIGENTARERILRYLSVHYYATNYHIRQQLKGPDEVHTLVCALMLLNTDLHGGMVEKKMTYNQFESNLKETNTSVERSVLKDLYNGIKVKPIFSTDQPYEKPKPIPTLEQYENVIHKQGQLVKKNLILANGKRPGIFKRRWQMFECQLRGSKLTLSGKSGKKMEITCHHCIAARCPFAHRTRHSVMVLKCADGRQFLLQARDDTDMQEWVHSVNKVAAMFSALPMAAPVSNTNAFQPPSLPMSRSRCNLEQQLNNHMIQVDKLTREYDDMIRQQSNQTSPTSEWQIRKSYLEYEKEKFEEYAHILNSLLYPASDEALMSPASFGRATANRMSYKRAVQKNVTPVNV